METKIKKQSSFSLRLDVATLERLGKNRSRAIASILNRYFCIVDCGLAEVESSFSQKEFEFIANATGKIDVQGRFRLSPEHLVASNSSAEQYGSLATRIGIDLTTLNDKCRSLSPIGVEALYWKIEKFYEDNGSAKEENLEPIGEFQEDSEAPEAEESPESESVEELDNTHKLAADVE